MSFHSPWTALANALKKLLLPLRRDSEPHLLSCLPTCIESVGDFFLAGGIVERIHLLARVALVWQPTLPRQARLEVAVVLVWSSSQV
ncbi:hypothetical protein AHAS_Ahas05G0196900 [Arachis hypogaea]